MRVRVSLTHEMTSVYFTDVGLRELLDRTRHSAKTLWVADEVGDRVHVRRSSYGYRLQSRRSLAGWPNVLQAPRRGVVRRGTQELDAAWNGETLEIDLGPRHEWPWISAKGQAFISRRERRARAVDELNARTMSARQQGQPAQRLEVPAHIREMLTPDEMERVMLGELV